MRSKYSKYKVFDSKDMPEEIRKIFLEIHSVEDNCSVFKINEKNREDPNNLLNKWLLENGAKEKDKEIILLENLRKAEKEFIEKRTSIEYKQLLKETPDYPGKPFVQKKLALLEQKLVNTNAPAKP